VEIEGRSIDYVPENERRGRVVDQGPFWFLGNFHFFTIAIGFVGPSMGLSLGYTALAGALGVLFGTMFVAFHASQGPELGLPQMVQSRAQFGFRGVVLVLFGTFLTFIGFNIVNSVLAAHGLNGILGWSETAVTLVAAAAAVLLAIFGHDWLHRIFRWFFFLSVPLYALLTGAILFGKIPANHLTAGGFTWVAFMSQFAASASFNITSAPCVSDFSRYLRREAKRRTIITVVFLGCSTSSIWLIGVGAWLATRMGASDGLIALRDAGDALFPGFGVLMALSSVAVLVATMGMNTYSAMLTVITALQSLFETRPLPRLRLMTILALATIWVPLSLLISANAIAVLFAALNIMLYMLSPWTSINLADYFFVRRGRYAITHLFMPRGVYGAWSARGLMAYAAGFLSSLPFLVLPDIYIGPVAQALGGVDIGWLVGLVVSGAVYLWLARSFDHAPEAQAMIESARILKDVVTEHLPKPENL
jgi:nucleobase:cation symporter-1, NCS1 family